MWTSYILPLRERVCGRVPSYVNIVRIRVGDGKVSFCGRLHNSSRRGRRIRVLMYVDLYIPRSLLHVPSYSTANMYYAIDIGLDTYGPPINKTKRIKQLKWQPLPEATLDTAERPIWKATFPNDESTANVLFTKPDGKVLPGRVIVPSQDVMVYPGKDAGGVCFVIEGTLDDAVRAAVRFIVFSFGRQGEFAVNIYGNATIREGLPLKVNVDYEDAMDLQSDDQSVFFARLSANYLKLKWEENSKDSGGAEPRVDEYLISPD